MSALIARFAAVRRQSLALCRALTPEDMSVQSMPDASPAKWHLAHTTWFFETFVLDAARPGRNPINPEWGMLFNSYYQKLGVEHARASRGVLSRPSVAEIFDYRAKVDDEISRLLSETDAHDDVVELGLQHEQQHQELLLTDIKHALFQNPLRPALFERVPSEGAPRELEFVEEDGGLVLVGAADEGFSFDNERPRHRVWLEDFALANRLITAGEYRAFIDDGGYEDARLWLSAGWDAVQRAGWRAPLYWDIGEGSVFTLHGQRAIDDDEPVVHVSYFEADAFATWAGARLPRESEWERVAINAEPSGNFAGAGRYHPTSPPVRAPVVAQLFGDVWEWTQSSYDPYPGFRPFAGDAAEYNGKFMHGQKVLRGGSCATPDEHVRASYRNFFYGPDRWQFSGIRLAQGGEPARSSLKTSNKSELDVHVPNEAAYRDTMLDDVRAGLNNVPRELPTQYLYDERGSRLFDEICELEEYYPMRTELRILRTQREAIAGALGPRVLLVEPGAGRLLKIRRLLAALDDPAGYVPVDISGVHLAAAAEELQMRFRGLAIRPVVADFTRPFTLPPHDDGDRRVVFFPGSTIGNFTADHAVTLLRGFRDLVGPDGAVLVGVDLVKDKETLEAAYNDNDGVSAAFSVNLLRHINRVLGANFALEEWHHEATWNEAEARIEIYLVSRQNQEVRIDDAVYRFEAGEAVRTEYSHKYTLSSFASLAKAAGLAVENVWTDERDLFSVQLLSSIGR